MIIVFFRCSLQTTHRTERTSASIQIDASRRARLCISSGRGGRPKKVVETTLAQRCVARVERLLTGMATTTITSRCSRCNRRDSKDVCGRCQYDIEIGDLRKGECFRFLSCIIFLMKS